MIKNGKSLLDGIYPILNFKKGRKVPHFEPVDRKCYECIVLEDEYRAIFVCPMFNICTAHQHLLEKYQLVNTFLDPDLMDLYEVADFFREIGIVLEKRWLLF